MRQSLGSAKRKLRSPFVNKRVSSISLAVVAVLAVVGSGIGMQVAAQATVKNPGKLVCAPKTVKNGKTCKLTFTDGHRHTGYQSVPAKGHKVCFATKAPNKATPTTPKCTLTNTKGVATGLFTAKKKGKATVTATESLNGTAEGTLTLTIPVS
jgi:hypothetical protein